MSECLFSFYNKNIFKLIHSFRLCSTRTVHPVLPAGVDESETSNVRLDLVSWSPKANAFVFVYEGNIFYQSSALSHPVAVTKSDEQLLNGITDWLYEEEILYSEQDIWWSPEGNCFIFARFNDSVVPLFSFDLYGNDDGSHLYPSVMSIKYPKVIIAKSLNQLFKINFISLKSR